MRFTNSISRFAPTAFVSVPAIGSPSASPATTAMPPTHHLHGIGSGHVARQSSSRVTIYHDTDHPSHLLLPVTRGNRIGTFMSGGKITT